MPGFFRSRLRHAGVLLAALSCMIPQARADEVLVFAAASLKEITGSNACSDKLDEIFARFCVGK